MFTCFRNDGCFSTWLSLRRRATLPADVGCYQRCGQARLLQRAGGCFSQVYSEFLCSSNPLEQGIRNLSEAAPVLSCWEETACYEYTHTEWASWIENRTQDFFFNGVCLTLATDTVLIIYCCLRILWYDCAKMKPESYDTILSFSLLRWWPR